MRGHFAYFKKNADSAFFNHNGGQASMNQNERVNFFECLRPKLTIFEVKPSIHRLAYGIIATTHSRILSEHAKVILQISLLSFQSSIILEFS